jgi:hypothetical protein
LSGVFLVLPWVLLCLFLNFYQVTSGKSTIGFCSAIILAKSKNGRVTMNRGRFASLVLGLLALICSQEPRVIVEKQPVLADASSIANTVDLKTNVLSDTCGQFVEVTKSYYSPFANLLIKKEPYGASYIHYGLQNEHGDLDDPTERLVASNDSKIFFYRIRVKQVDAPAPSEPSEVLVLEECVIDKQIEVTPTPVPPL